MYNRTVERTCEILVYWKPEGSFIKKNLGHFRILFTNGETYLSAEALILLVQVRKLNMFNEREIEENEIPIDSNLSSII